MELDVTKNINLIESLKCRMLEDVSLLYGNMMKLPPDSGERTEILADIVLTAFSLADRMGQNPQALEEAIINKLRIKVLENSEPLYHTHTTVLKHMMRKS